MQILRVAEQVLEVHFAEVSTPEVTQQIRALQQMLEADPAAGGVECVPAFLTLTMFFQGQFEPFCALVREKAQNLSLQSLPVPTVHRIGVCYHESVAPDLPEVCHLTGLSRDQVVALHTGTTYTVQMLGFMPGFPYLSGLDSRLQVPRKAEPRLKVPVGSVGLAGKQTGIYPLELPGGWQIIGRSKVQLFDPARDPPALLRAGDQVQFFAEED